jgi:hypothetical protein
MLLGNMRFADDEAGKFQFLHDEQAETFAFAASRRPASNPPGRRQ